MQSPCLKGYHASTDRLSCVSCEKGFRCPVDKLDAGVACVNGTYQDQIGQEICIVCPAGFKCPSSTVTPVQCDNGTYSLLGNMYCETCPAGYG